MLKLVSVAEAAKAVGKDRTTLYRLINDGQISEFLNARGKKRVDPTEVERFFDPNSTPCNTGISQAQLHATLEHDKQIEELRVEIKDQGAEIDMLERKVNRREWWIIGLAAVLIGWVIVKIL